MSYEVLVDELRAAAGRYRKVADSLGSDGVEIDHVDPASFGHIELAAWVKAVAEQCDNATKALHDGATDLADGLVEAAHHYETTDTSVGQVFQSPFTTGRLGPSSPFGPVGTTP
jgi:excreted virulence factor EspC (type VII ESX diderm)